MFLSSNYTTDCESSNRNSYPYFEQMTPISLMSGHNIHRQHSEYFSTNNQVYPVQLPLSKPNSQIFKCPTYPTTNINTAANPAQQIPNDRIQLQHQQDITPYFQGNPFLSVPRQRQGSQKLPQIDQRNTIQQRKDNYKNTLENQYNIVQVNRINLTSGSEIEKGIYNQKQDQMLVQSSKVRISQPTKTKDQLRDKQIQQLIMIANKKLIELNQSMGSFDIFDMCPLIELENLQDSSRTFTQLQVLIKNIDVLQKNMTGQFEEQMSKLNERLLKISDNMLHFQKLFLDTQDKYIQKCEDYEKLQEELQNVRQSSKIQNLQKLELNRISKSETIPQSEENATGLHKATQPFMKDSILDNIQSQQTAKFENENVMITPIISTQSIVETKEELIVILENQVKHTESTKDDNESIKQREVSSDSSDIMSVSASNANRSSSQTLIQSFKSKQKEIIISKLDKQDEQKNQENSQRKQSLLQLNLSGFQNLRSKDKQSFKVHFCQTSNRQSRRQNNLSSTSHQSYQEDQETSSLSHSISHASFISHHQHRGMPESLRKNLFSLFSTLRHQIKLEKERERVLQQLKNPFADLFERKDQDSGVLGQESGEQSGEQDKLEQQQQKISPGLKLQLAFQNAFIQFEGNQNKNGEQSDQKLSKRRLKSLLKSEKYTDHFIGLKQRVVDEKSSKVQQKSSRRSQVLVAASTEENQKQQGVMKMQEFKVSKRQMQKQLFIKKMRLKVNQQVDTNQHDQKKKESSATYPATASGRASKSDHKRSSVSSRRQSKV